MAEDKIRTGKSSNAAFAVLTTPGEFTPPRERLRRLMAAAITQARGAAGPSCTRFAELLLDEGDVDLIWALFENERVMRMRALYDEVVAMARGAQYNTQDYRRVSDTLTPAPTATESGATPPPPSRRTAASQDAVGRISDKAYLKMTIIYGRAIGDCTGREVRNWLRYSHRNNRYAALLVADVGDEDVVKTVKTEKQAAECFRQAQASMHVQHQD